MTSRLFLILFLIGLFFGVGVLSGSDFSLEDVCANSGDNDVINLPSDDNVKVNNMITVDHNLTIKGDNSYLPIRLNVGSSVKCVFKVLGNATLTLENVEVSGLNIDNDCEIIYNNNNLVLLNCVFNNNMEDDLKSGYVIHNLGNSNVTVDNCRFENNNMQFGDVIASQLSDNVNILRSTFKNNQGRGYGSALRNNQSHNFNINESHFDSNSGRYGGAIYNTLFSDGRLIIMDSNFTKNIADVNGGAIYNRDGAGFKMNGCYLIDNSAQEEGGGIYNDNCDDFTIETSIFTNNSGIRGGGVYTSSAISNIGNSGFYSNHAGSGGAIYNHDGKKYSYVYDHSFFENNGDDKVNSYGGAVTLNNANYKFTQTYFGNNSASKGASIYLGENSHLDLRDDVFRFNKFNNSSYFSISSGGAIYNGDDGGVDILRTNFISNSANSGGAIFSRNILSISGSLFENNSGTDGGAVMTTGDGIKKIDNTTFSGNIARGSGGGLYNLGNHILINNSKFNNNHADKGGGLYDIGRYLNVSNSFFKDNSASIGRTFYFDEISVYIYLIDSYIDNRRINEGIESELEVYVYDHERFARYIYVSYNN